MSQSLPRGLKVFWEKPRAGAVGGGGQTQPATPGGGGDGVWWVAVGAAGRVTAHSVIPQTHALDPIPNSEAKRRRAKLVLW